MPLLDYVAAISVGIHEDELVLDLNYEEDSNAEMDMNVVMLGSGEFVEVQGTAEGKPFSKEKMDSLIEMARGGINQLFEIQRNSLGGLEI
jgi:ribonuclease PH